LKILTTLVILALACCSDIGALRGCLRASVAITMTAGTVLYQR
jgi:hypothetical protein